VTDIIIFFPNLTYYKLNHILEEIAHLFLKMFIYYLLPFDLWRGEVYEQNFFEYILTNLLGNNLLFFDALQQHHADILQEHKAKSYSYHTRPIIMIYRELYILPKEVVDNIHLYCTNLKS
jgi:hypothetical protein